MKKFYYSRLNHIVALHSIYNGILPLFLTLLVSFWFIVFLAWSIWMTLVFGIKSCWMLKVYQHFSKRCSRCFSRLVIRNLSIHPVFCPATASLPTARFTEELNPDTLILKMTTAMFDEMLKNLQHSVWHTPRNQNHITACSYIEMLASGLLLSGGWQHPIIFPWYQKSAPTPQYISHWCNNSVTHIEVLWCVEQCSGRVVPGNTNFTRWHDDNASQI
jgi:hypothetical protein